MEAKRRSVSVAAAAAVILLAALTAPAGTARADTDLWPLYQSDDEGTIVLYPFYVHEGEFVMMFPFYYRTNEGKDHHYFWPLVKTSEGRLTRVAPIWFSGEEEEFTLFPIIRQTPDYTFWMAPPMYFAKDGHFKAVFPLYVKTEDYTFIAPGILRKYENGRLRRFMGLPLFDYLIEDDDSKKLSVLPVLPYVNDDDEWALLYLAGRKWGGEVRESWFHPAYWRREGKDESKLWLLPYFGESTPERSFKSFLPLYARTVEGKTRKLWLLPYFQERSPDSRVTTVFPLFSKARRGQERSLWAGLYYEKHSPDETRHIVFPAYVSGRTRDPKTGEVSEDLSIFLWAYHRDVRRSKNGRILERNREFLLFGDDLDPDGGRTFKLLGIPVMERTEGPPRAPAEPPEKPPTEARAPDSRRAGLH